MRSRYLSAVGRSEKTHILDESVATTGYDRKYLIKSFNKAKKPGPKPKGRGVRKTVYGPELLVPLKAIWKAGHYPCSKRLKAMIPLWLPCYEALQGELEESVRNKLLRVSASTLDRL